MEANEAGIRIIQKEILEATSQKAIQSDRKRMNHNFHQLEDRVQRMLNALEPDTYVRPHRHLNPPKIESFILLRGSCSVLFFDDYGEIRKTVLLDGKENLGVDISPGIWHSLICHEKGTVVFEVKDGPYVAATDKDFATWAPAEKEAESAAYREKMRRACSIPRT